MKRAIFVGVLTLALSGGVLMAQTYQSRSQSTTGHVRTAVWNNGSAILTPVRDHDRDRDDRRRGDRDRDDWRVYDRGRTYRAYPYVYSYPYTYTSPYYSYPYSYPYSNPGYIYRGYDPYGYGYGYNGYGYSDRDYRHLRHEQQERLEHERKEFRKHHHH